MCVCMCVCVCVWVWVGERGERGDVHRILARLLRHCVFTDEVKSRRPVNFTDSKTQLFRESSPCPWQQRPPSRSRERCPPLRRR